MHTPDNTDVTSTLTDLERKLVDLERELGAVSGDPPAASAGAAPLPPPAPSEHRDATLRVEDLRGEIAGLVRFRDQLETAARELVTEYDRLVDRLRGAAPTEEAATPPEPAPTLGPAPVSAASAAPAPTAWSQPPLPAAVAAGIPPQPPGAEEPPAGDSASFVGAVVIDAGPFTDITTLQAFEQGLGRVEGAEDVYVRSFEGDRALIDVRLSNPVPLVQLLRESLPLPIIPREAGEGRLTVDVVAAESHGT
jgi:hypothetical protein